MPRKLLTSGNLAMLALAWVPLWAIGGLIVGGHTAIMAGIYIAALPLLLGLAGIWVLLVIRIDSAMGAAVAFIIGVPVVLWIAGLNVGLSIVAASLAVWCISRIVSRRRDLSRA